MVILGIDPGYAIVGWGVIEYKAGRFRTLGYGAITTPASMPMEKRFLSIYQSLEQIVKKYRPEYLSIEKLFFTTNAKTAIDVAQARGVILLCCTQNGLDIFEYTPLQVKQAITGYGKAIKKQVMEMSRVLLNLPSVPKPDDTADALALAICHAHSFHSLLNKNTLARLS